MKVVEGAGKRRGMFEGAEGAGGERCGDVVRAIWVMWEHRVMMLSVVLG